MYILKSLTLFICVVFVHASLAANSPNVRVIQHKNNDKKPPSVTNYLAGLNKSTEIDVLGWDHNCTLVQGDGFIENKVMHTVHYLRCVGKGGTVMQSLVCPSDEPIAVNSLTVETPKFNYTILLKCKTP